MAFFAACMLNIALELAEHDPVYEDMASKFFEHFIAITDAINNVGEEGRSPVHLCCKNIGHRMYLEIFSCKIILSICNIAGEG